MVIIPVILSGGSGTRLWPLSRKTKPKQFLNFGSDHSLFQNTVLRCKSDIFDEKPIVVGADPHRFLIAEDLLKLGIDADILLEPCPRNSCAAIAAGAYQALSRDDDALILVLAADHKINDVEAFSKAVALSVNAASAGKFVTFGIQPSYAATGYGYIKPKAMTPDEVVEVESFIEKPDADKALDLISQGCLWNSGNFLFSAKSFINELQNLEPKIIQSVNCAYKNAHKDIDFLRLEETSFALSPSISVDYAVMEKTQNASVMPVTYDWSDVGSWASVKEVLPKDDAQNSIIGNGMILDGNNNLIVSHNKLTTVAGVNNATVVTTRDAVLVVADSHSQEVKTIVEDLQSAGRAEANDALQVFRPWGNYEQLDLGSRYLVKRITINPGGILSLQKHQHRAEHWVVVSGRAEVTIGDEVKVLEPNQSIYIPIGMVHRLANRENEPVVLIEVQTGDYLAEDDITRLDDVYNRGKHK